MHFPLQTRTKLACALFSLPIPSNSIPSGEEIVDKASPNSPEQKMLHKLLLVGHNKSGTSTIFKQVISVVILHFMLHKLRPVIVLTFLIFMILILIFELPSCSIGVLIKVSIHKLSSLICLKKSYVEKTDGLRTIYM